MSTQAEIVEVREEIARAGERIYELRLKTVLEPQHIGRVVAIHIPSQDYFLADSILDASDRLREKYPDAERADTYIRGVGERALIRAFTPRVVGRVL